MKLIFKSIIVCAIIAIGFYVNYNKKEAAPLLLENIEALANGESGDESVCMGYGTVLCPRTGEKVYVVYTPFSLPNE